MQKYWPWWLRMAKENSGNLKAAGQKWAVLGTALCISTVIIRCSPNVTSAILKSVQAVFPFFLYWTSWTMQDQTLQPLYVGFMANDTKVQLQKHKSNVIMLCTIHHSMTMRQTMGYCAVPCLDLCNSPQVIYWIYPSCTYWWRSRTLLLFHWCYNIS